MRLNWIRLLFDFPSFSHYSILLLFCFSPLAPACRPIHLLHTFCCFPSIVSSHGFFLSIFAGALHNQFAFASIEHNLLRVCTTYMEKRHSFSRFVIFLFSNTIKTSAEIFPKIMSPSNHHTKFTINEFIWLLILHTFAWTYFSLFFCLQFSINKIRYIHVINVKWQHLVCVVVVSFRCFVVPHSSICICVCPPTSRSHFKITITHLLCVCMISFQCFVVSISRSSFIINQPLNTLAHSFARTHFNLISAHCFLTQFFDVFFFFALCVVHLANVHRRNSTSPTTHKYCRNDNTRANFTVFTSLSI